MKKIAIVACLQANEVCAGCGCLNAFQDRTQNFDYKIEKGDLCYTLFTEKGFEWGGDWTDRKDFQHFELPTEITEKYSEMYEK